MKSIKRFFLSLFQGNKLVIGIPYGWFILLVAIPLMIVMKISLSEMEATSVSNMISWTNGLPTLKLNFANYQFIFSDALYVKTYISSLKYALITTLICLAIVIHLLTLWRVRLSICNPLCLC